MLWLLFILSILVFLFGKSLDYNNSLDRVELNPRYKDAQGRFDAAKFIRVALITLVCLVVAGIILGLLSAYLLLLPSAALVYFGIEGIRLSRIQ